MATLESSDSVYNAARQRLTCTYVVDGVSHTKVFRNSPNDSGHHATILADHGVKLVRRIEETQATAHGDELLADGNWDLLPETTQEERDHKQRIAQHTVRVAVVAAIEGIELQKKGRTRSDAAERFFVARKLLNKIIPNLTGNAANKASYLALTPGPQGEWGKMKAFHDDLVSNASTFVAMINYMDAAPAPIEILSEVTL